MKCIHKLELASIDKLFHFFLHLWTLRSPPSLKKRLCSSLIHRNKEYQKENDYFIFYRRMTDCLRKLEVHFRYQLLLTIYLGSRSNLHHNFCFIRMWISTHHSLVNYLGLAKWILYLRYALSNRISYVKLQAMMSFSIIPSKSNYAIFSHLILITFISISPLGPLCIFLPSLHIHFVNALEEN